MRGGTALDKHRPDASWIGSNPCGDTPPWVLFLIQAAAPEPKQTHLEHQVQDAHDAQQTHEAQIAPDVREVQHAQAAHEAQLAQEAQHAHDAQQAQDAQQTHEAQLAPAMQDAHEAQLAHEEAQQAQRGAQGALRFVG